MNSRLSRGAAAAFVVLGALLLGRQLLGNGRLSSGNRVTILYDAFGRPSQMIQDWGYSALVEYGGKRVLFDTGNNPRIFAQNVKAAGVNLKALDAVVISHRHLDHTAGLNHLLGVNPEVKIYAPREAFGPFGGSIPSKFYRRHDSLPAEMRYFGGHPEEQFTSGSAWPAGKFVTVDSTIEISTGVYLISLISEATGTKELRELSLAIYTPEGMVVIAGCSHPGIEKIVERTRRIDPRVHSVFGGFHLPTASDEDVSRIASALYDTYKVQRIAPGHCTGEPAFYQFKRKWKGRYRYAGVGSIIDLP